MKYMMVLRPSPAKETIGSKINPNHYTLVSKGHYEGKGADLGSEQARLANRFDAFDELKKY